MSVILMTIMVLSGQANILSGAFAFSFAVNSGTKQLSATRRNIRRDGGNALHGMAADALHPLYSDWCSTWKLQKGAA